ncbi:hypothetical protein C8R45DRAFT_1103350 [Mycena sanguinolenta]|nr:hypothetical protein C8R45DRAFT_1103350 [Mycena sanguinolenta]
MTVNLTIKHSIPYDLVLGSDWHLWCRDTLPNDKIQQPFPLLNLVRWMLMLNLKLCSNVLFMFVPAQSLRPVIVPRHLMLYTFITFETLATSQISFVIFLLPVTAHVLVPLDCILI